MISLWNASITVAFSCSHRAMKRRCAKLDLMRLTIIMIII